MKRKPLTAEHKRKIADGIKKFHGTDNLPLCVQCNTEKVKSRAYRFCSRRCAYDARIGQVAHNKGQKTVYKEGSLERLIAFRTGRKVWNDGLVGVMPEPWNKGRKMSQEYCDKLSEAHKGQVGWGKGLKRPERSGANCHLWRGGHLPDNTNVRSMFEYRQWRIAVWERDNYTCTLCGKGKTQLNADHIKPFAKLMKELRILYNASDGFFNNIVEAAEEYSPLWDINNGRTLCVKCHKATPTYMNRWHPSLN